MGILALFVTAYILFSLFFAKKGSDESKRYLKKVAKTNDEIAQLCLEADSFTRSVFSPKKRSRNDFLELQEKQNQLVERYAFIRRDTDKGSDKVKSDGLNYSNKSFATSALKINSSSEFLSSIIFWYSVRERNKTYSGNAHRYDLVDVYNDVMPLFNSSFEYYPQFNMDSSKWLVQKQMEEKGYTIGTCNWLFSFEKMEEWDFEVYESEFDKYYRVVDTYDRVTLVDTFDMRDACPPRRNLKLLTEKKFVEKQNCSRSDYILQVYEEELGKDKYSILLVTFERCVSL